MSDELTQAQAAYESGDIERAHQLAQLHLERCRHDPHGWQLAGLIECRRGRYRESVAALESASLLAPLVPAARVGLAYGYARIGRVKLSLDLLVSLIPDESLSVAMLLQVGSGLDLLDQPEWALKACREAARRDPSCAQAFYDQGYYAARCGLPPSVVESLARRALALETRGPWRLPDEEVE